MVLFNLSIKEVNVLYFIGDYIAYVEVLHPVYKIFNYHQYPNFDWLR